MTDIYMERVTKEDVNCLALFDCGNPSINSQIKGAYDCNAMILGAAYKFVRKSRVLGYCMLQIKHLHEVEVDPVNRTDQEDSFGAVYLKYVAVDKRIHGRDIGTALMQMIIDYVRMVSEQIPIRFFFLEALPEALGFYKKFEIEFSSFPNNENLLYVDLLTEEMIQEYEASN